MNRSAIALYGVIFLVFFTVGCQPSDPVKDNYLYIRDTLGGIVLDYRNKTGHLPESFGIAHTKSGKTLSHRGDLYGGALSYKTYRHDCFFFISSGPDDIYEMGKGDDLVVVWENGKWFIGDADFAEREYKQKLERIMREEE